MPASQAGQSAQIGVTSHLYWLGISARLWLVGRAETTRADIRVVMASVRPRRPVEGSSLCMGMENEGLPGSRRVQADDFSPAPRGLTAPPFVWLVGPVIRALIFDFDGLVIDTETPLIDAWAAIHERAGHAYTRADALGLVGHVDIAFDPWTAFGSAADRAPPSRDSDSGGWVSACGRIDQDSAGQNSLVCRSASRFSGSSVLIASSQPIDLSSIAGSAASRASSWAPASAS